MTLSQLIAAVERAEGADREAELAIWLAFDPRAKEQHAQGRLPLPWMHLYMSSLDWATKLIPEGCTWTIEPDGAWVRWLDGDDVAEAQCVFTGRGGKATAIAVTAAALRAHEARAAMEGR